jgi:glycine/D-amino acid oxidase-like deaminating enzyme
VRGLRDELEARRGIGIDVRWLSSERLQADYGIDSPGALLSGHAARVDPYRMASRLLQRLAREGVAIHDRTSVSKLHATSRRVVLEIANGARITADHAIVATGYAAQQWIPQRVARNRSSYAFISDPLDEDALGGISDTVVWETARPYLYMRSTEDGRMLVGGEDDRIDIPARRDRRVDAKAGKLVKRVAVAMPQLPTLVPAFAWGGTFAETKDGLPFFGPHEAIGPRVQFAMAYGGNGITYSTLGGALLRAHVERRAHPLKRLFGFERLKA